MRIAAMACGLAGCVAISGVGDLTIDRGEVVDGGREHIDGAVVAPPNDASSETSTPPLVDAGPRNDAVTLSGTGVAVGAIAIATLTTKDAHGGGNVVFTASDGTSVLAIGATTD